MLVAQSGAIRHPRESETRSWWIGVPISKAQRGGWPRWAMVYPTLRNRMPMQTFWLLSARTVGDRTVRALSVSTERVPSMLPLNVATRCAYPLLLLTVIAHCYYLACSQCEPIHYAQWMLSMTDIAWCSHSITACGDDDTDPIDWLRRSGRVSHVDVFA